MTRIIVAVAAVLMPLSAWAADATEDAQFGMAAADFVTKNCPGLVVDSGKLAAVLQDASMSETEARQSALYQRLITSYWPNAVAKVGMQEACYQLQVHFVTNTANGAKGNLKRMIVRQ